MKGINSNMAQPYWINQHNKEKPVEKNSNYSVLLYLMFLWSLIILWAILKTLVRESVRKLHGRTNVRTN